MLYEQLKHYFIINFPQRAGALRSFVVDVLGEKDDIVYFQYIKKNNRSKGPAMVGIELQKASDLKLMEKNLINFILSMKKLAWREKQ